MRRTGPRTYGYARVSTKDQNLVRQLDALREFGVEGGGNIFADKASGKDFERPEWLRMVAALDEGDVLVVKPIDRFGRNYEEIIEQWRVITMERRAEVVVLDMPLLDTRNGHKGVTARSYPTSCCSCSPSWRGWSESSSTGARQRRSSQRRRAA